MRTDARRAAAAAGLLLMFAAGCREQAPPEIPRGRLVRVGGQADRSLRALVPEECLAGVVFQRLESGEAALMILGTGLTRADTVFWNGRALRTGFGHSRLLTGAVPPGLLETPGRVEVTVEDTIDPSRPKLRGTFVIRPSP